MRPLRRRLATRTASSAFIWRASRSPSRIGGTVIQCRKCRSPVSSIARPGGVGRRDDLCVADRAAGLDDARSRRRRRARRGRRRRGRTRRTPPPRPRRARPPWRRRAPPRRPVDCWPAPMPTATPSFASTIALDDVRPHTRQASDEVGELGSRSARASSRPPRPRAAARTRRGPGRARCRRSCAARWSAGPGGGAVSSRVALRRATSSSRAGVGQLAGDHDVGLWPAGDRARRPRSSISPAMREDAAERAQSRRRRALGGTPRRRSVATAAPQALACFTMHGGGHSALSACELVGEPPRGVGVEEVEVAERDAARAGDGRPRTRSSPRAGSARRAGAGSRRSAGPRRARASGAASRGARRSGSTSASNHATIAAS